MKLKFFIDFFRLLTVLLNSTTSVWEFFLMSSISLLNFLFCLFFFFNAVFLILLVVNPRVIVGHKIYLRGLFLNSLSDGS